MADNNPEVLHVIDVPLAFYEWLATVEKDVRVHDLMPHEIAGLQTALRAPAVSEEAGWQPIETAPRDGASGKPETYVMLSKQEQGTTLVCTGYVNEHGAFEWWGGGMMGLTHWRPLPAPPTTPTEEPQS